MENKKKKGGRPVGTKSKINLPFKSVEESIEWTRKIYEKAKDNEFHPDDLPGYIGIGRGFVSPVLAILDKFGLIQRATLGWNVSQLGKEAIRGNKNSIIECVEKIDLYRELLRAFSERKVNKSIIVAHLKSKYKYGDNTESIADKFIEEKKYIDSIETNQISSENTVTKKPETPKLDNNELITLLKVKYAFQPSEEISKVELINELHNNFKDYGDTTIESLVNEIKKNKSNDAVVNALVNAFLKSFEKKYPVLKISRKKEVEKNK